jgi:hypothetical protein
MAVAEKSRTRASPPRHLSNIKTSSIFVEAKVTPTPGGVKIWWFSSGRLLYLGAESRLEAEIGPNVLPHTGFEGLGEGQDGSHGLV